MSNKQEFFAEATQAWFEATVRTDVTSGLRTKHELYQRDPELAAFMLRVYGSNDWVYPDTAPGKLRGQAPRGTRVTTAEIQKRLRAAGHDATVAQGADNGVSAAASAPAQKQKSKKAAALSAVMGGLRRGIRRFT